MTKWCNLYEMWADEVDESIDEAGQCSSYDCNRCGFAEDIQPIGSIN